jgi:hypothetical protein
LATNAESVLVVSNVSFVVVPARRLPPVLRGRSSRPRGCRTGAWALAGLVAAGAAGLAHGQTARDLTAKDDSVRVRPHPLPGPIGLELDEVFGFVGLLSAEELENKSSPLASFLVHPKLETDLRHESNLYYESDNPVADQTVVLRPSVTIASDWANHELKAAAGGEVGIHRRTSSEDYEDFFTALDGRIDVTGELNANGGARLERRHESRGRPDDPGRAVDPVVAYAQTYRLGTEYKPEPYLLRAEVTTELLNYLDSPGFDGDERDRRDLLGSLRLGYEFVPGTTTFVEQRASKTRYRRSVDNGGFLQGSHGYETMFGATWNVSGVTFAEVAAGYLVERYEEPRFSTIKGPTFSATLLWNATDLLTITANGARTIEETAGTNISGILVTSGRLTADFELSTDLIVTLGAVYRNEDSRGIDRTEDVVNALIEASYRIDSNLYTALRYEHAQRFSAEPARDYRAEIVTARFGVQY